MKDHPFDDMEKEENEFRPLEPATEQSPAEDEAMPQIPGSGLYDWAQALVTAIVIIVLAFIFLGRIIGVDGTSMVPTLHDGDRVLVRSAFMSRRQETWWC